MYRGKRDALFLISHTHCLFHNILFFEPQRSHVPVHRKEDPQHETATFTLYSQLAAGELSVSSDCFGLQLKCHIFHFSRPMFFTLRVLLFFSSTLSSVWTGGASVWLQKNHCIILSTCGSELANYSYWPVDGDRFF